MTEEFYSIVIVDDEKWALVYLRSLFDCPDLGFHVIASCRLPSEAIEIIEKEKPDILITDIRMPEINGIELIEHVRLVDIPCEVVIISGFAEFTYAQQAVKLGAFEYIVKPVSSDSAIDVLKRLKKRLQSNRYPTPEQEVHTQQLENNNAFEDLLQYIEKNYNQRLYLKDLAQQFCLAPNYCCNLFLKAKGMTFSQYITNLRMEKSVLLLKKPDLPINKIALMVGFDDYTYFNRVFKRTYKCTPTEYRKQNTAI